MSRDRLIAVLLLLVALAALTAQRMFPFVDDAPWTVRALVVAAGVTSALVGTRLWVRGSDHQRDH